MLHRINTGWMDEKTLMVRGQRVMLESDLTRSLGRRISSLEQAVKRNRRRFSPEVMFRFSRKELSELRSLTGYAGYRRKRRSPVAFTKAGVLMLSEILNGRYPPAKGSSCRSRIDVYSRESILIRRVRYWTPGKKEEFRDRKCFVMPELEKIPAAKKGKNRKR